MSLEISNLTEIEIKKEKKELTLTPRINNSTSIGKYPRLPPREELATYVFYHRVARGKEKTDFMKNALDYRVINRTSWKPSLLSRSISASRTFDNQRSCSPIMSEFASRAEIMRSQQVGMAADEIQYSELSPFSAKFVN